MNTVIFIAALATKVLGTGVLLPLYVYPGSNSGAYPNSLNWQPVYDAITDSSDSGFPWIIVIDPANGPGIGEGYDPPYINGTASLNNLRTTGYPVTNVGYVHLKQTPAVDSPPRSPTDVEADITLWRNWSSYTADNISVQGIFFDESQFDGVTPDYIKNLTDFARAEFDGESITTVCNFGTQVDDIYYSYCDVVICYENVWLNWEEQSSLNGAGPNNPSLRSQAAVLVHNFTGTDQLGTEASVSSLRSQIHAIKANGTGWTDFTSDVNYNNITITPADIGAVANAVASA